MKNLLTILILLFFIGAEAQVQTITYTPMTAAGYQWKYGKFDSGLNVPNVDTSTFRGTRRGGSLVFDTTARIFYGWNGIRWSAFGSGGGGSTTIDSITIVNNNFCIYIGGVPSCITLQPDTIYVKDDLTVTIDSLGHQVIGRLHDDGLISGGIVTKSDCWKVDVTMPTYYFNGTQFIVGQVLGLDIDTADSDPRVDYVVADSFGLIYVIKGIPSPTPQDPVIDIGYQVLLPGGRIYIPGGASCLSINVETIYDEHTIPPEWTVTNSGTITVDFDNLNNPYHLTKAIFVSSNLSGASLIFTRSTPDTVVNGMVIKGYAYLNSVIYSAWVRAQFFLDTVPVTNAILFKINQLDTSRYQVFSVLGSSFTWTGQQYDKLVLTINADDPSGAQGFYLDWLQIQTGMTQTGVTYVESVTREGDSLYYWKSGIPTFITGLNTNTGGGGIGEVVAGYGLVNVNDSTLMVDTAVIQKKISLTTGGSGAATLTGNILNIPTPTAQVTSYQTQTASGATAFTFTSVPASTDDYMIFRNGCALRPTTDYTTAGNVVTIPNILSGDIVRFQRVK